jgi:response regulator NasT
MLSVKSGTPFALSESRGKKMLNVMLIRDEQNDALRDKLQAAGIHVVAEISPLADFAAALAGIKPDVVLVSSDASCRDTLEGLCMRSDDSALPVVMFTNDNDRSFMQASIRAGVAAYVVGEVPSARLLSLLDVAIERFALERSRRLELNDTRRRLAERQDVEKAKGILMKMHGVDEDQAYRMLRKKAMQTQRRIGQIAAALIEAHTFL